MKLIFISLIFIKLHLTSQQCFGCEGLGELAGRMNPGIKYYIRKPAENVKNIKVILAPEDKELFKEIEISKSNSKIKQRIEPIDSLQGINRNQLPLKKLMKTKLLKSLGADSLEDIMNELLK